MLLGRKYITRVSAPAYNDPSIEMECHSIAKTRKRRDTSTEQLYAFGRAQGNARDVFAAL